MRWQRSSIKKKERKKERSCRRACERESADADGRDSGADDDDDDGDDDVVTDDEVDLLSPLAPEFLSQFFGITGKLQSNRSASVKFQIR